MENSSSRVLHSTHSYNSLSFVFISDLPSAGIYNKPLTARPNLSVLCKLSVPTLCTLVTSRTYSVLSNFCLIPIVFLPLPFCPHSTCSRVIGISFQLQEGQLSERIYYFVIEVQNHSLSQVGMDLRGSSTPMAYPEFCIMTSTWMKNPYFPVNNFRNQQDFNDFQVLLFQILMQDWGFYVYIFFKQLQS